MTSEALEQIARDVAGAADIRTALAGALATLPSDGAVHVAESVFYRLPLYSDATLLRTIAAGYAATGEATASLLIGGMAGQITNERGMSAPDDDDDVRAVLDHPLPYEPLRARLEALRHDPAQSVSIVLRTWTRLPPVLDFWILLHAIRAFAETGQPVPAMVLAGFALQLAPTRLHTDEPAHRLVAGLLARGRIAAAGALSVEWSARTGPKGVVVDGVAATARVAPLPTGPAPIVWTELFARDEFPPAPPRISAAHARLNNLAIPLNREAVLVARLVDVEVSIVHNQVAVERTVGGPVGEVWVGLPPTLAHLRAADAPVIARTRVVIVSDGNPVSNYSHFLSDQALRLALYARAGVALDTVSVIGPRLEHFQRQIAGQFGAGEWVHTDRICRIRAKELWILSTCAEPHHPAHFGAPWARAAIRDAFGVGAHRDGPGRRLYVSRSDADRRRLVNEAALLDRLLPLGYEVVVPGKLTVAEQAALFAQASHVVGPHGAGLTNILFCAPGTRFLELMHPYYGTFSFAVPALAGGLDYDVLVGTDAGPAETAPADSAASTEWLVRDFAVDEEAVMAWARAGMV